MKPFDGVMDDVSLREELNTAGAVLTFGRFNPPTSGHELLVNKVLTEAKKRGADNFIFASHSKDKRKNPLDSKTKTNYMKTFFRNANVMYNPSIRTIFDAIGYLADQGYKEITVVVGGDRVDEFEKTIRPYVNHPDPDKSFDLNSFKVVSAGRRDPDATDVTGMSASKMRQAASEGDFETFKKGVPSKANDRTARKLFDDLRKAMGIREEHDLVEERKASKPIKVLVFSGYSEENDNNMMKTAKRIKEECKKRSVPCFVAFVPFARSFKNDDGTRTVVNKDGKEFIANRFDTVVVVRGAASGQSGTLDMISSFEKDGFFVINSRDSIEICSDKYRTSVTLVEAGLPTPRTALVTDPDMIEDVHKQVGGKFPVVAKTLTGSKGQGVFIIDSKPSLNSVIDAIQKIDEEEEIILQEYIDMKSDMRIIVLDGKVVGVMNRGKVKNDFRSNFSMGAKIKKVSISKEIEDLALKAAKVIGCYYCGVDIAISAKTKKPYIIEVNSSPGSEGIEMATKQNIVGDFIDHILDKDNWMYSPTIVGRRETLSVEGIGPLVGKFDTGNMVVNSIHADNYQINGDTVTWTHGGKTFTNKVVDILTVLQGAIAHDVEKRPMIELDIEFMGKRYPKRRFTLDDRSQKGTPVLVGVPFMKEFGIVVDPGKTFIKTEKLTESTLTKKEMQLRDKYAKDLKKDRTSEFKKRYGKDYKEVIFATATNMAKKEQRKEEEYHSGNLDGTPELTRKRRRITPGQFNEMASDYFHRRTK
jgi:RimK family alpha-L-glutamate ligase